MKSYRVIAVSGGCIRHLVGDLVANINLRGYMEPASDKIEVDEEKKIVHYNGKKYEFVEYRAGIHGYARIVAFKIGNVVQEVYTDTPAYSGITREKIIESFQRRKSDPHSGY